MTIFWADSQREVRLSYEDLVDELTTREERHPVVQTEDPSELFVELLMAILGEEELTLLDDEFSSDTLSNIGFSEDVISQTQPAPDIHLDRPEQLPAKLEAASSDWTVGLYTSGTTGNPSRVDQTLEGLTRSVRQDDRFQDHVWAFAYNPSHFAGLQVFFQAVSNLNPIIYIFEQSVEQIEEAIRKYGITHISATPTFYRLRLQRLSGEYETVQRLTSGGEKFESSLRNSLQKRFPNAEFRNVYALTEAGSLLESEGELFSIPEDYQNQLRITEEDELAIHESLLDDSTIEDLDSEWFHTGDLVEYAEGGRFRFVGRQSDFVNVGGYRVNPHEVEQFVNSVETVEVAAVTARESSVTGHILVAKVQPVPNTDPATVKDDVKKAVEDLEEWKQPRIIDVVDEIPQSRSGKRVR